MEEKKDIEIKLSEALTNWSKWLITINFSTATGCIIKFNNLGVDKLGTSISKTLFFAIVFFAASVLISIFLTYLLSKNKEPNELKPLHFRLCELQITLFLIGLIFLCWWVGINAF